MSAATRMPELSSRLTEARQLAKVGHLDAARSLLRRLASDLDQARRGSTLTPKDRAALLNQLGLVWQMLGGAQPAELAYRRALELNPSRAQTWNDLASLMAARRPDEAEALARRALDCDPDFVPALVNLGALLLRRRSLDEATRRLQHALSLAPTLPVVHANLGACWLQRGESRRAIEHLQRATTAHPGYVRAWLNLGTAFERIGEPATARRCYERATEIDPNSAKAHQNLGMLDLSEGNYVPGWQRYESRRELFPSGILARYRNPLQPERIAAQLAAMEQRSSVERPRLLVYAEQGLGDTLQFARFIPQLARGYQVAFHCQPELVSWFSELKFDADVVANDHPPPDHDCSLPLLSLGAVFVRREPDIPPPLDTPILPTTPSGTGPFTVGIAWRGNSAHDNDVNRSIDLAQLAELRIPDGWRVHCLDWAHSDATMQQSAAQLAKVLQRPVSPGLLGARDFAATADAIQQLDLVVSVDTALVHLAASLLRPTWLLLPLGPDWRWGTQRTDSPWYPTLRVFRQAAARDWAGVLAEVNAAFSATSSA